MNISKFISHKTPKRKLFTYAVSTKSQTNKRNAKTGLKAKPLSKRRR